MNSHLGEAKILTSQPKLFWTDQAEGGKPACTNTRNGLDWQTMTVVPHVDSGFVKQEPHPVAYTGEANSTSFNHPSPIDKYFSSIELEMEHGLHLMGDIGVTLLRACLQWQTQRHLTVVGRHMRDGEIFSLQS